MTSFISIPRRLTRSGISRVRDRWVVALGFGLPQVGIGNLIESPIPS